VTDHHAERDDYFAVVVTLRVTDHHAERDDYLPSLFGTDTMNRLSELLSSFAASLLDSRPAFDRLLAARQPLCSVRHKSSCPAAGIQASERGDFQ